MSRELLLACEYGNKYEQNHFWPAIYSTDQENAHTKCQFGLLPSRQIIHYRGKLSTKTHLISINIALALRYLRPHCSNFHRRGQ